MSILVRDGTSKASRLLEENGLASRVTTVAPIPATR